jgi:hypothetical protein
LFYSLLKAVIRSLVIFFLTISAGQVLGTWGINASQVSRSLHTAQDRGLRKLVGSMSTPQGSTAQNSPTTMTKQISFPSLIWESGDFSCKISFVCNAWWMTKFPVLLSFLQATFHLLSGLLWGIYGILVSSPEPGGERHLKGGVSELPILPTAQQVKVTLHFAYFPPISICEQSAEERRSQERRSQHENQKWWKMIRREQ